MPHYVHSSLSDSKGDDMIRVCFAWTHTTHYTAVDVGYVLTSVRAIGNENCKFLKELWIR